MTGSPLPSDAILLHIGPHKTGTTAIQGILADARQDLAAVGVTYPGFTGAHHQAARTLAGYREGWADDQRGLMEQRWNGLSAEARATPGRVVISSEFFALAKADGRRQVVEDLGDRLHIVIAARNPGSIALSTWQQVLRDGKTAGLEGWLHQQFERPEPMQVMTNQGFWSWADPATLVAKWSEVIDPDRIHVIVLDEQDKLHLPRSFEQLLGLEPGMLTRRRPPLSNRSLTVPEAELLEHAIGRTHGELSWNEFSTMFRYGYASHLLRNRTPPADEPRAALPEWAADQARAEADDIVSRLRVSGADIIGDPEHLVRVPAAGTTELPDSVSVDLAADAIAGVAFSATRRIRRLEQQIENLKAVLEESPRVDSTGAKDLGKVLARRIATRAKRSIRGPK